MKIQSRSDIITNSSSEVFLIDAECAKDINNHVKIDFEILDIDYLKEHLYLVHELCGVCKMAGVDFEDTFYMDSLEDCDEKDLCEKSKLAFIEHNADKINDFLKKGYALVIVEEDQDFDINALRYIRKKAIWSEFY